MVEEKTIGSGAIEGTKKILPKDITSYDLLKAFAVIIMIIDHVGFYFFPEQSIWRSVGRIGFPIWFFLVGYARSRDFSMKLWVGAIVLVAVSMICGHYLFPMNALVTIIVIRLVLDPYIKLSMANIQGMFAFSVTLFILIFPTGMYVEYGTQALIMAVFGYLVRNRESIRHAEPILNCYMFFALASFLLMQATIFSFSQPLWILTIVGTLFVMAILFIFTPKTFPKLTNALPNFVVWIIQLMGRRTLEIYVVHLVVFKFALVVFYPDSYQFFDWALFYQAEESALPDLELPNVRRMDDSL